MKKGNIVIYIMLIVISITLLIVLDYLNLPSILGFEISNINWDFCMGIINIIVIIALYALTYKILDEKAIEKEKNKYEISLLLIKECYQECLQYTYLLNHETVEKYIVPKIDFNSTNDKNAIFVNLQNSPFLNENIYMDLVKDGQISKRQIEAYLGIKNQYKKYINMIIIFFDNHALCEELKTELCNAINNEIKKIDTQT